MRPADFNVQELISALQGTCTTIEEHLPEGMEWSDLTKDDHKAIDNEIFLCEQCGWWCENCEQSEDDETLCNECSEEE